METTKLRRFAQYARRTLLELIETRLQFVLQPDSAARREAPAAVKQLEAQIQESSREQVIDRVAYTWFNRFCALRYMDVNRVNRISVVSPLDGQFQPEILAEAKMGHIDEEMVPAPTQAKVRALLDGTAPSPDPQQEAYRLLVVAACNYWQGAMPFLFEAIADYTELLMPDDLLSGNSILAYTREAMTPDACEDVEVIGWLYQFYISEKKDDVFEGLKKNKKITPENIPAATQLFTPHWIVRYLVENSLGRLWLLNWPNSKLAAQMDYYIAPQEPVTDFLRIAKPEDIKLCDPACGSGHMLTYAFDLLYAIYEEQGTDPAEIPEKILTQNLYGVEIDERAAELAAFALAMKAQQRDKRFFRRKAARGELVKPNICVLRPIKIAPQDLDAYVAEVGRDLFTANLRTLLTQFVEAENFGSLIRPVAMDYAEIRRVLAEKGIGNQLLLEHVHRDVLRVLEQAEYLSQRYQIVVANPPYMGSGGMNPRLSAWAKSSYASSKMDLFSMFMERTTDLTQAAGYVSMVTMQSWMFLSSYEKLRLLLLSKFQLCSLVQIGYNSFPELNSKVAQACAFIFERNQRELSGSYINLNDAPQSADKNSVFLGKKRDRSIHWSKQSNFTKISGTPIAYWVTKSVFRCFEENQPIEKYAEVKNGMSTTDNERFTRLWYEVNIANVGLGLPSAADAKKSEKKWFPYNKGGLFRRWFGNFLQVVNWENDGREIKKAAEGASGGRIVSEERFFQRSMSWSKVSSGKFAVRMYDLGFIFDVAGPSVFSSNQDFYYFLGLLNSRINHPCLEQLSPTINFEAGQVSCFPIKRDSDSELAVSERASVLAAIARKDWDMAETSWSFSSFTLLASYAPNNPLDYCYAKFRDLVRSQIRQTLQLEEENNRTLIGIYRLQDELAPDVSLNEITLTCNPHYRYGGDKSEQELEDLLRADTMREFISYAVGCLFGRYSLDKPGLILANQGETLEDYLRQIPEPRFTPDADNVIPLLDGDWFPDDITGRFREFLRVTFGDEHYDENLRFIENALGKKGKPLPIRDFFLKEFYTDHIKRYKKRPIYWLFSSPKGSFNALIYLHRYRPDTASIILQYLRDFRSKLVSERDHQTQVSISTSASQGEKTKALKRIEELKKILVELDDYERDTLYPLATRQVPLDLDDGVKVNYAKLGAALKKIPGLDAKDED
jgi:type II restriction/modification system DNA methylase subunit YeeA